MKLLLAFCAVVGMHMGMPPESADWRTQPEQFHCAPDGAATGVEAEVCADIAARQRLGLAKYGVSVADNPLSTVEWIDHTYNELLDAAIYLKRLRATLTT